MNEEIKESCYNCQYYLSDYENCQGVKEEICFEYQKQRNYNNKPLHDKESGV